VLPIEKLINDMQADVLERRKVSTYIKAIRKWVEAELRESASVLSKR
jgi:hypothetical protein